jgi:hypothetical protein
MSDDFDPLVTITDMRPLFCVKGVKKAFANGEGDFANFLRHGAKASELRGRGFDGEVDRVVESIKARSTTHGR